MDRRIEHSGIVHGARLALLVVAFASSSCAPGAPRGDGARNAAQPVPATLADGMYAVTAEATTRDSLQVAGSPCIVLRYDRKYTDSDLDSPPEYLAIDPSSYVPLILAGPPDAKKDERGWTMLSVTLRHEHVQALETFTRAHLGGKVAMILDGEVISKHKIRSVIADGRLQITRCGDNACEVLRAKLAE
jgi:hypothetical protein